MAENPTRALSRIQNPASEAMSLAEAKLYLRVDGSDDDTLISTMMEAVREAAEEYLQKSLVTQRWRIAYEDYAPLVTPLPRGPVQNIISVKRRTRAGVETLIPPEQYHLNARSDALHFASIAMAHQIEIIYEAGYDEDMMLPSSIRQGMLVHLAALYENRIGGMAMPAASVSLYKPHREVRI